MDCWSASLREAEEQAERKRAAAINALQTKTRLNIASLTLGFTPKRLHPSAPCPAWHSYVQGNISKNRLIGFPVGTATQGVQLQPCCCADPDSGQNRAELWPQTAQRATVNATEPNRSVRSSRYERAQLASRIGA